MAIAFARIRASATRDYPIMSRREELIQDLVERAKKCFSPWAGKEARGKLSHWARVGLQGCSDHTLSALLRDWRHFMNWVAEQPDIDSPGLVSPENLAKYFRDQVELAPATLEHRRYSLRALFDVTAHPDNPAVCPAVRQALESAKEEKRLVIQRKWTVPLRWNQISTIVSALTPVAAPEDAHVRMMLGLAYDGMLRPTELARLRAKCVYSKSGESLIGGTDLGFAPTFRANCGVFGMRVICSRETEDWCRQWIQYMRMRGNHYLVCRSTEGVYRLSTNNPAPISNVRLALKMAARRAGLEWTQISGLSPRIGAAYDLLANGTSIRGVADAGRWNSISQVLKLARELD